MLYLIKINNMPAYNTLPAGVVVQHVSRLLASSLVLQRLTKNQMDIYRTPATEIWTPKSDEYVPEVVESQNVKKLKGMFDSLTQEKSFPRSTI